MSSSRGKSSYLCGVAFALTLPSHSIFSSALYAMTAHASTSFMRIHIFFTLPALLIPSCPEEPPPSSILPQWHAAPNVASFFSQAPERPTRIEIRESSPQREQL